MDTFSIFTGLGGLLSLVIMAFAAITPIMIYLIQRNTYQNRQELRRVNKNLETLHFLLGKQTGMLKKSPAKKQEPPDLSQSKPADNLPSNTITMTCEHCGKSFKYGTSHSGKYKPCPGCQKSLLLK